MSSNPFRRSLQPQTAVNVTDPSSGSPSRKTGDGSPSVENVETSPLPGNEMLVRSDPAPSASPASSQTPPASDAGNEYEAQTHTQHAVVDEESSTDSTGLTDDDPFRAESEDEDSVDEQLAGGGSLAPIQGNTASSVSSVPPNPFERTLATMQSPKRHSMNSEARFVPTTSERAAAGGTRTSLDVDSFKRLLMTGNAGSTVPGSSNHVAPQPKQQATVVADSSSSTDASSISRHSIFEHTHEPLIESPRTSYDQIVSEEAGQSGSIGGNPKQDKHRPPPPRHRHGKLVSPRAPQTVSFTDFETTLPPSSSSPTSSKSILADSPSDLNKPLPPRPPSPERNVEPETNTSILNPPKTPPRANAVPHFPQQHKAPSVPLTRRHTQLLTSTRERSTSNSSFLASSDIDGISDLRRSNSARSNRSSNVPPPPPPTRRPGSNVKPLAGSPAVESRESAESIPTSFVSSPSHKSSTAESPLSSVPTAAVRSPQKPSPASSSTSMPPPPPPRRRGSGKSSIDITRADVLRPLNISTHDSREPARLTSTGPPSATILDSPLTNEPETVSASAEDEQQMHTPSKDILADITALQQEVEALRSRYGNAG